MRAIIRIIIRETTDEETIKIKQKIQAALKDYKNLDVELSTMG